MHQARTVAQQSEVDAMTSKARFRSCRVCLSLAFTFLLALPGYALGAELHLREALLEGQRDQVTATITAEIDQLGERAHPLEEDCDLHVPLRSPDIRVPLLAELKNACSEKPAGTTLSYWSQQIAQEVGVGSVSVTGVFRIWLEHPPPGNQVQSEAAPLPAYPHSNPDHQVELHPLLQIASLDFRDHVKLIKEGEWYYEGYGPKELRTVLQKRLTVQRIGVQGQPYIRIRGAKTGFNHWNLRGRVAEAVRPLADGVALRLDILRGNQVVPGAVGLPAVAVAGTAAHTKAQVLAVGDIIEFQALGRLHVPTLLDQAGTDTQQIPLPIEFVFLDLEVQ